MKKGQTCRSTYGKAGFRWWRGTNYSATWNISSFLRYRGKVTGQSGRRLEVSSLWSQWEAHGGEQSQAVKLGG